MKNHEEQAKEIIERFTFKCRECDYIENAKQCAIIAVEFAINDLKESFEIAKESNMHPHAKGLIAGSIVSMKSLKTAIENYEK